MIVCFLFAFVVVNVGCVAFVVVGDVRGQEEGRCVPTQEVTEGIQYQKQAQKLGQELKVGTVSTKVGTVGTKSGRHKSGF